jgi:putative ABC transport system ATP-binding protein
VRRDKLGFIFQFFNLLPSLSCVENVALPLHLRGWPRKKIDDRARELLDLVKLSARMDHLPDELSGGERQRVAIARALSVYPPILLADEPTGNLDTRTSIEVMGIFQRLNREQGITILLITHEMDIAEYGTRLIRFRDGRVVADQPVLHRRNAADELAALPPPEPDLIPPPPEPAATGAAAH